MKSVQSLWKNAAADPWQRVSRQGNATNIFSRQQCRAATTPSAQLVGLVSDARHTAIQLRSEMIRERHVASRSVAYRTGSEPICPSGSPKVSRDARILNEGVLLARSGLIQSLASVAPSVYILFGTAPPRILHNVHIIEMCRNGVVDLLMTGRISQCNHSMAETLGLPEETRSLKSAQFQSQMRHVRRTVAAVRMLPVGLFSAHLLRSRVSKLPRSPQLGHFTCKPAWLPTVPKWLESNNLRTQLTRLQACASHARENNGTCRLRARQPVTVCAGQEGPGWLLNRRRLLHGWTCPGLQLTPISESSLSWRFPSKDLEI